MEGNQMKVIRILDAGVFADERGNIIPDNEFFDCFSHEGDYLSIRTVSKVPSWFPLIRSTARRERIQKFGRLWQMIEDGGCK
jgi:hypothetical protein